MHEFRQNVRQIERLHEFLLNSELRCVISSRLLVYNLVFPTYNIRFKKAIQALREERLSFPQSHASRQFSSSGTSPAAARPLLDHRAWFRRHPDPGIVEISKFRSYTEFRVVSADPLAREISCITESMKSSGCGCYRSRSRFEL